MHPYKSLRVESEVLASYDRMVSRWGVETEQLDVSTACGTTHCVIAGDASLPPLLLFHGVGDNSAVMWVLNIGMLSKHFRCIAVDTLGGPGRSRPNSEYARHFARLDWQLEILDALSLEETNVVGVSYGAYMAYDLCVKAPHRVRRAVCIEGGIVTSRIRPVLNMISLMFPEMLIPTKKNLSRVLGKMISPASDLHAKHPYVIDHMLLLMRAHNRRAMYVHKLDLYREDEASGQREKLLFLLGDHRVDAKQHLLEPLRRGGYSHRIIADAGHALNHEQPQITNQHIVAFLE